MLGSITGAGFPPALNPIQTKASSAYRYKHHSSQLTVSASNLSFGSTALNTPTTQTLALTASGTSAITINSVSITGSAFSIVAQTFPVILNPSESLTIQVQFDPTASGNDSEQLTINSDASSSPAVVALSGTGTSVASTPVASEVSLNWVAPADSTDPVTGYNIYRSTSSGSFTLLNTSPVTALSFVDNAVASGSSYNYQVTSVDSSGAESVPSNEVTVNVP
jgi:hypothetical protein